MAYVTLSVLRQTITATIRGLENPASQYDSFEFNRYLWNGTSWIYSGAIVSASNTVTMTNLNPATTYTVNAKAKWEGIWYNITGDTVPEWLETRPYNFEWDTPKIQGRPINITASEWNRLTGNVISVHSYKFGEYDNIRYPLYTATQGMQIYAEEFYNLIARAIQGLPDDAGGLLRTNYQSGDIITASAVNLLRTELNVVV